MDISGWDMHSSPSKAKNPIKKINLNGLRVLLVVEFKAISFPV
jgi:hypothetical protein